MPITSFVGADGSVRITLDGRELKLREATVDTARNRVLEHARDHAATTGTVQVLTASDPAGEWMMHVYPTGEVVPAPPAVTAQPAIATPPPLPPEPLLPPQPLPPAEPPRLPAVAAAPQPVQASAVTASAPDPAEDVDGGLERTVLVRRKPQPSITVRLHTGEGIETALPVLLGRKPEARTGYSTVALLSPGREVSRTHAVVDVDEQGQVVIIDENSANGTYIDGEPATPGVAVVLPDGCELELGDITVHIEKVPA